MRNAIIGGALTLALSFTSSWAQAPADAGIATQFAKAAAQHQAGQSKTAHETLVALTNTRDFAKEAPEVRGRILALDAEVAASLGLLNYTIVSARSASKLPGQEAMVPQVALYDAISSGDHAAERRALIALANGFPETLNVTLDRAVVVASGHPTPDKESEALQAEVAEALVAHWRPRNRMLSLDTLRLTLILTRLSQGRIDEARQLTTTLDGLGVVTVIRMDRRYDGLFADGWSLPTPRAMTEAQLIRLRALRAEDPRHLVGARREAELLHALNADEEALQGLDAALAQADRSPSTFEDLGEALASTREVRGLILDGLQRHKEALEARRHAAQTPQAGEPNISQTLNLASELSDEDPRQALNLLRVARQRGLAPYAQAVAAVAEVCAHHTLGNEAESDAAERRLAAIRTTGVNLMRFHASLCRDKADDAAATLITALNDLGERPRAMFQMQVSIPVQPPVNPQKSLRFERLRAVALRPDVQAALAPHGRILTFSPEDVWRR